MNCSSIRIGKRVHYAIIINDYYTIVIRGYNINPVPTRRRNEKKKTPILSDSRRRRVNIICNGERTTRIRVETKKKTTDTSLTNIKRVLIPSFAARHIQFIICLRFG